MIKNGWDGKTLIAEKGLNFYYQLNFRGRKGKGKRI